MYRAHPEPLRRDAAPRAADGSPGTHPGAVRRPRGPLPGPRLLLLWIACVYHYPRVIVTIVAVSSC